PPSDFLLQLVSLVQISHRSINPMTSFGQGHRRLETDSGRAAGDEHTLAREILGDIGINLCSRVCHSFESIDPSRRETSWRKMRLKASPGRYRRKKRAKRAFRPTT